MTHPPATVRAVQAEAAWRARHKWAAQRLAHLLSDAHERPPLGPAFDLLETLSLNIGLAVDGMAVGSFATPAFHAGSAALESASGGRGWAAPGAGGCISLAGSLRTHRGDPDALTAAFPGKEVRFPVPEPLPVHLNVSTESWPSACLGFLMNPACHADHALSV